MQVNALDHVNIACDDIEASAVFYADLLSLEVFELPPPAAPDMVRWLRDKSGRAIIHLNAAGSFTPLGRSARPAKDTGAVHHVAFDCTGHDAVIERLDALGLQYAQNTVAALGIRQIFVPDPNGLLLELNFTGD